jgi:tetratricopeptide (TPR) repeat protein
VELRASPNAYINLGYVNFRLRRYEEAAVASQQAVAVAGGDYRPAGNLAETYYWQPGQRAQSAEWFRRAIGLAENQLKVNAKDWFVHATVAKYYAYLGDKPRARQHLAVALAGEPNEAGIHYRAAVVHNLFGEREAALQSLQKALALGYAHNEVSAAVEFDNFRRDPRLEALLRK